MDCLHVAMALMLLAGTQPLVLEHLVLDAPEGWVLENRRGPDFAVFYIRPPGEGPTSSIGVYLGNHASSFAPQSALRGEAIGLGLRKGNWRVWQETSANGPNTFHAEAILKRPFGVEPEYSTHLHVFLRAASLVELTSLQGIVRTLRPVTSRK